MEPSFRTVGIIAEPERNNRTNRGCHTVRWVVGLAADWYYDSRPQ
jgi:hypothetical protein